MTQGTPTLIVLAGPNGAGKPTFYDLHFKKAGLRFVNTDDLARALDPLDPSAASYAAAKVADLERRHLVAQGESFCMETVFSDPVGEKLSFLLEAQAQGYRLIFIFIGLSSAVLSQARVIGRVAQGGHDVPDQKVLGRYPRTLQNLRAALPVLHEILLYDNSEAETPYRLVARVEKGKVVEQHLPIPRWMQGLL